MQRLSSGSRSASIALFAIITMWGPFGCAQEGGLSPKQVCVYNFVDRFKEGQAAYVFSTKPQWVRAGGEVKAAIFQHANEPGEPLSELSYEGIALPQLKDGERLVLHFFTAIKGGEPFSADAGADGCEFIVRIDGDEVFREPHKARSWREWVVDVSDRAGKTVTMEFLTAPRKNNHYDWAAWGRPRLVIDGREPTMEEKPMPPHWEVSGMLSGIDADRVVEEHSEEGTRTVIAVLDEHLDLATQLQRTAPEREQPLVPLAPRMVVGEGPHPDNHTVVRVLNRYGIANLQFLAYPPEVRGGVQVFAADIGGEGRIVAAPISSGTVREIRIFTLRGGLTGSTVPQDEIKPPYAIAVGDFVTDSTGDEIAVASRNQATDGASLHIYGGDGALLDQIELSNGGGGQLALSAGSGDAADRLIALAIADQRGFVIEPDSGRRRTIDLSGIGTQVHGLYQSAYSEDALIATGPGEDLSEVFVAGPSGDVRAMDVGEYENQFWIAWGGLDREDYESIEEGEHVRFCVYGHIRTDASSPGANNPEFDNMDPEYWAGEEFLNRWRGRLKSLTDQPPRMWEPCFTHRWFANGFDGWRQAIDQRTGTHKYRMLTRSNEPTIYGEFGNPSFRPGTYAFGLPALNNLYVLPLGAFLRHLAPFYREHPERMVSVEPNHEHEITTSDPLTVGDYNAEMVQGYFEYLVRLYGDDVEGMNRALGSDFGEYFDAPRGQDRGKWDEYSDDNPFFVNWAHYNRYVVNRRLAQTYREALLAGFPPAHVKSHQIPDSYAVGSTQAFSSTGTRITPIDYAMAAGVGYGYTRYGVWYKEKHNVQQGAWSSGFDNVVVGEYQALTPNVDDAYGQLRWMFDHGVRAVHCMHWPQSHDRGFNKAMHGAIKRLAQEDPRRPGVTGGVGQVRAYTSGEQRLNVACIGTGGERTGLLKSVTRDGDMEGTVYVVPFDSHVDIETVREASRLTVADEPVVLGPFDELDGGQQIEVVFRARCEAGGTLRLSVNRGDTPLPGLQRVVKIGPEAEFHRIVFRVQMPAEGISIRLVADDGGASIELRDFAAYRETERIAHIHRGIYEGERHRGGVTFDILK